MRRRSAALAAIVTALVACVRSTEPTPARISMTLDQDPVVFTRYGNPPVASVSDAAVPRAQASPPPLDPRIFRAYWKVRLTETAGTPANVLSVHADLFAGDMKVDLSAFDSACANWLPVGGPVSHVAANGTAEYCQSYYAYPDTTRPHRVIVKALIEDGVGQRQELTTQASVVFR